MNTDYSVGRISASEADIFLSPKRRSVSSKYPVMFVHGAEGGAGAIDWMGLSSRWPTFLGVVDYGQFFGVSADLGGSATWGNDVVISRMTAAYSHLQGKPYTQAGKVNVIAQSMGATSAMAWTRQNKSKVNKIVLVIPVLNLLDVRNNSGYQGAIDAAYGGAYSESSHGSAHNPLTMATNGEFAGIPIQVWYGQSDTLCKPEFATDFISKCNGAIGKPLTGGHEETTVASVNPKVVADFLNS